MQCKKRAVRRRANGQPIADPIPSTPADDARATRIVLLEKENARLRALVSRLGTSRRRHQIRANDATKYIEAANKRADEARAREAVKVRAARESEVQARALLHDLSTELTYLRAKVEELSEADINLDKAELYIRHYDAQARKQLAAIAAERRQMAKILRDWDYLARRYFNQRTPEMYTEHDYSILKTWQARNRQRGAAQKKNTRNPRRTR